MTPLHCLAIATPRDDAGELVKQLMDHGASLDAITPQGDMALHIAVKAQGTPVLDLVPHLLVHGGGPHMMADRQELCKLAETQHGADHQLTKLLNAWSHWTPLMLAAFGGQATTVELLLSGYELDLEATVQCDGDSCTALDLALGRPDFDFRAAGCGHVAQLLQEAALGWSVRCHRLFPIGFRRSVFQVLRLAAMLTKSSPLPTLESAVWLEVIRQLPRSWSLSTELTQLTAQIDGLQSTPTLNGTMCQLCCFDEERGRYAVELPNGDHVKLKPHNLQLRGQS